MPAESKFGQVIEECHEWQTIQDLVKEFDRANYWTEDFLRHATYSAKAAHVRREIRKVKDDNGNPVWASIEKKDEEGKRVRVYKQELLFSFDDYQQVTLYWHERKTYCAKMERGYRRRCKERFSEDPLLNLAE